MTYSPVFLSVWRDCRQNNRHNQRSAEITTVIHSQVAEALFRYLLFFFASQVDRSCVGAPGIPGMPGSPGFKGDPVSVCMSILRLCGAFLQLLSMHVQTDSKETGITFPSFFIFNSGFTRRKRASRNTWNHGNGLFALEDQGTSLFYLESSVLLDVVL